MTMKGRIITGLFGTTPQEPAAPSTHLVTPGPEVINIGSQAEAQSQEAGDEWISFMDYKYGDPDYTLGGG